MYYYMFASAIYRHNNTYILTDLLFSHFIFTKGLSDLYCINILYTVYSIHFPGLWFPKKTNSTGLIYTHSIHFLFLICIRSINFQGVMYTCSIHLLNAHSLEIFQVCGSLTALFSRFVVPQKW